MLTTRREQTKHLAWVTAVVLLLTLLRDDPCGRDEASAGDDQVTISGVVHWVDRSDRSDRTGPDRCKFVLVPKGGRGGEVSVEAREGIFTAVLARGETYEVFLLSIGAVEPSEPLDVGEVAAADGRELLVHVPQPARPLIHVRRASDSRPVAGARAVACPAELFSGGRLDRHFHPPGAALGGVETRGDRDGKLRLPVGIGRSLWFVSGPALAWRALWIDHSVSAKARSVNLYQAGVAVVRVKELPQLERAALELEAAGVEVLLTKPSSQTGWRVESLSPGDYKVAVRDPATGQVYGAGLVSVRAGRTTEVVVEAKPVARLPKGRLISVVSHSTWVEAPGRVELVGVESCTQGVSKRLRLVPEQSKKNTFSTATDGLPAGRYRVCIAPMQWCSELTLVPDRNVSLTLPPPVAVEVLVKDVKDVEQGAVLQGAEVLCIPASDGAPARRVPYDAARSVYRFQAVPGTLRLSARARGFRPSGVVEKVIRPGRSEPVLIVLTRLR